MTSADLSAATLRRTAVALAAVAVVEAGAAWVLAHARRRADPSSDVDYRALLVSATVNAHHEVAAMDPEQRATLCADQILIARLLALPDDQRRSLDRIVRELGEPSPPHEPA